MGLKKKKCRDIISKVSMAVSDFEKYAAEANIREKIYAGIKNVIDRNKAEL